MGEDSTSASSIHIFKFLTLGTGNRSQRKAAPSPLQTSTSATSPSSPTPTRTAFARPATDSGAGTAQTVRYTPQMTDQPRSPKERLDDLLASERSFYTSDEAPPDKLENGIDSRYTFLLSYTVYSSGIYHTDILYSQTGEVLEAIEQSF